MRLRLALVTGLLLLVAACSSPAAVPVPASPVQPAEHVQPIHVAIPKIDVTSTLTRVDLAADRTLQVPPVDQPEQAAWFVRSAAPGDPGMPTVVVGHVNGSGRPGVFVDLHTLTSGDEVLVERVDGSTARFEVYRVEAFDKDQFPTDAVYRPTSTPELRAITCGGEFEGGPHGYADNIVVFARYAGEAS